ncbi:unnamed protein product [Linum tenue]|uniref:RRM domain-containing protein n=1 Tax=Linum tenue TaxID=586396 RepID=A0AAV0NDZ2_9ROSI|nr:unnamed protein product [Linum tenue]
MEVEELEANGMSLKGGADMSPGEGKSNRLKSNKKKWMQEVGMIEVEKHVNGDNTEEDYDVEGSRTRLKSGKKKMMKNTEVGGDETCEEEVKKGSKRKKQQLLEETERDEEGENDVDGGIGPDSVDDTTESLNNERKQSLVGDKKERMKREKKKQRLLEETAKADRRGVCYLSRIPPHMDPAKLRHALSQYGEIQRIYLVPEDSNPLHFQKKAAKHRMQSFAEGWVEFTDKVVAKRVANMLNGEQMGGKKRSQFYFDTWNIKYLSKFKWDDLTEEIAIKRAVREQKLALELSAAKRERDFYLSKVEKSIALTNIEERLKKVKNVQSLLTIGKQKAQEPPRVIRRMPQKKPVTEKAEEKKSKISMDVLAGVFGGSSG